MAFISENGIELTDEHMEALSGGDGDPNMCLICKKGKMRKTGKTRPGRFFGDLWPDVEMKCSNCGELEWWGFCF